MTVEEVMRSASEQGGSSVVTPETELREPSAGGRSSFAEGEQRSVSRPSGGVIR